MARQFATIDEIIKTGFEEAVLRAEPQLQDKIRKEGGSPETYDDLVNKLKTEGKLDDDDAHRAAGGVVYGLLGKFGINPEEWKFTITPQERGKLRYGPEEYNDQVRFLGSWSAVGEAALTVATLSGIVTAGLGITLATIAQTSIALALKKGLSVGAINILREQLKLKAIKWLSAPAFLTAAGTAIAMWANIQLSATGDAGGYLLQNAAANQQKLEALEGKAAGAPTGTPSGFVLTPKTRITMTKQSKPNLFIGTLFSQRISSIGAFERKLDDQVTSKEDLATDAQANLNKWLASLPSRLFYTINVALNPFDENGIKQTGYWATLSIFARRIAGTTLPIDTILLGPVDPVVYYPKPTETLQIQSELPKLLTAQEIANVEFPTGEFQVVDKSGSITPVLFRETQALAPSAPVPVVAPATPTATPVAPTAPTPQSQFVAPAPGTPPVAAPAPVSRVEPSFGVFQTPTTPPSAPKIFEIGARIQTGGMTGNTTLRVRQAPALTGAILGGQPNDTTGTLAKGPFVADGEVWWYVNYDRNDKGQMLAGWSAERYLRLL